MRPPNYPVIHIKGIHFKNPFAILPAQTTLTYPNGRVTPELLMFYKRLTATEAALVITGPATVTPPTSRKYSLLRVDQPKYLDGLRALSKIVSANGAIPGIQITHPAGFEANELPIAAQTLSKTLLEEDHEKLVTAFRNACQRSLEVGFRYVELDARGGLALHQLVVADAEWLLREVFINGIKAVGSDAVLGLRLDGNARHAARYAAIFRELGGDLIGVDPKNREPDHFYEAHNGHSMENLQQHTPSDVIFRRLTRCRLLSMTVDFPKMRNQILSFG